MFTYANGSKYVGNFSLGEKDGVGEFIGYDGENYKGEWKLNMRHGYFLNWLLNFIVFL